MEDEVAGASDRASAVMCREECGLCRQRVFPSGKSGSLRGKLCKLSSAKTQTLTGKQIASFSQLDAVPPRSHSTHRSYWNHERAGSS